MPTGHDQRTCPAALLVANWAPHSTKIGHEFRSSFRDVFERLFGRLWKFLGAENCFENRIDLDRFGPIWTHDDKNRLGQILNRFGLIWTELEDRSGAIRFGSI